MVRGWRIVASPLPSMVFTPPSVPPFPGDRNPSGEGSTNSLSSLLKKQIPNYMLFDILCAYCALVHQHIFFYVAFQSHHQP